MEIEIKKWDFSSANKVLDIPNFAPNFEKDRTKERVIELRKDIISQVVRWQLAKKRDGNASTKTRSQVSGTTRKPWAQKETGKARQGSLRSPHFRGGGVVFGPHPRCYSYSLNKKFRKLALGLTMNLKLEESSVIVIDSFSNEIRKTKDFIQWLKLNNLVSVLFVGDFSDSAKKSFSNLYGIDLIPLVGLNVLSCLKHKSIVFDLNSITGLIERYSNSLNLKEKINA